MAKEWIEAQAVRVPEALRAAVGGHPLVAQILVRRGFDRPETVMPFLDPKHYLPAAPADLPNLVTAVARLSRAIRERERICVWGDFDVDGQTSTTLLASTLRDLGANVSHHIPHRERESHGVNLPVLRRLLAEGIELVLTCDTGVTAHAAIDYARERGVDVVVTDHHDLPPILPQACAVVNPKMLSVDHPLRELPGVGVTYKLAEALYEDAGRPGEAEGHLDLVALGIVADVAVQSGDTRYLLQRGLAALRRTERLGLQELIKLADLKPESLTEEDIGFQLAPRLNALGRLGDAQVAVELLSTQDRTRARILAAELEGLNAQRKLLVDQVMRAALAQIERDPSLLEHSALVLTHPSWPGGVIGIVAGRLAERFNRPAVLITTPAGGPGRGSARSVADCNITQAIAAHKEMLLRFGGHPMAAGLAIEPKRIPAFRQALSRTVHGMRGEVKPPVLPIDAYLSLADLSLELVEEIERLAPFGPGNPKPVFASRDLSLASKRILGRHGDHLMLTVEDQDGAEQKVLWWYGAAELQVEGRFDLAYELRGSDYRGQRELQVLWVDARSIEMPGAEPPPTAPTIQVVDHRQHPEPGKLLARIRAEEEAQVWSEAGDKATVGGRDRNELGQSKTLVIWTVPPGPVELQAALQQASPELVHLVGVDPGMDHPERFLRRLAGLVKHALSAEAGLASLSTLAAATAQREATVRAGLAWLEARGHLELLAENGDEIQLARVSQGAQGVQEALRTAARMSALLEETAAYRAYFLRTRAETLV